MKDIFIAFLIVGTLLSCNNDDDANSNTKLVGNWKLIEVLWDPGDGSGTFKSVESDKIITFNENGTLSSNGLLCENSIESNNPTSGTYSILEQTFSSSDCSNPEYKYTFEQHGNILIINYPCIELCRAKYKKKQNRFQNTI